MKRNLQRFIEHPESISRWLEKTEKSYRQHDPGWYLYRKVASIRGIQNRFTDEFIELVYVTLTAWNMNSRGAKLSAFDDFKNSILSYRKYFEKLSDYRLENLTNEELKTILANDAKTLFYYLDLVAESKPRLVTYSKTLHFFLPNLFVPIDRKYTLNYFYGNSYISKKIEKQFAKFSSILQEFHTLAVSTNLSQFIDNIWNANIPKTIDNTVIGYMKGRKQ